MAIGKDIFKAAFLLTVCCLFIPRNGFARSIDNVQPTASPQEKAAAEKGEDSFVIGEGQGKEGTEVGIDQKVKDRKARAVLSQQQPQPRWNDDAVDTLLMLNEDLPTEIKEKLIQLDIMNSGEVTMAGANFAENFGRKKRGATVATLTWPGGRIPYAFDHGINTPMKRAVEAAMAEWMSHTCLHFVPRGPTDSDYLFIAPDNGCFSSIGRVGGAQILSIGSPYCHHHGIFLHELGHAIGFSHEQNRLDRDDHVVIHWNNMYKSAYNEFTKTPKDKTNSLGVSYDFNSIMQYSRYAFSENGLPTMEPLDPAVGRMGQRFQLSPLDTRQANLLYNCSVVRNNNSVTPTIPHPEIPGNAFLIKSGETRSCLAPLPMRDSPSNPITYHSNRALYPLGLVPCDLQSHHQFWQWINNDTLLHVATYLCLGVHYQGTESEIVLQTCKESLARQKWNCMRNHIHQPSTSECVAIKSVGKTEKKAATVASEMTNLARGSVSKSNTGSSELKNIEVELGSLLLRMKALKPTKWLDSDDYGRSQFSNQYDASYKIDFEACDGNSNLQKWSVVDSMSDDDHSSICSKKLSQSHNLPYCYPSDMESASGASHGVFRWASCSRDNFYVTGFYQTYNFIHNNFKKDDGLLSGVKCCAGSTGLTDAPEQLGGEECVEKEWGQYSGYQENLLTWGWFTCPLGMFLKGFYLSAQFYAENDNLVRKGRCCRPANGPLLYERCYIDSPMEVYDGMVHACRQTGYYIVEVEVKDCDSQGENCKKNLKCCSMSTN